MKRLKVLVFDDTPKHRESAKFTLGKNHDLTVVGTYEEAQAALLPKVDEALHEEIFFRKYGDREPYKSEGLDKDSRDERIDFYHGQAEEQATAYPDFDVVLTDLLVPASGQAQGSDGLKFIGQEMPLGTSIALLALCAGIKNVAVMTDKNHHDHPASAAFDAFEYFKRCRLSGVNILCTNRCAWIVIDSETGEAVSRAFMKSDAGKEKYPFPAGQTFGDRKGIREEKGKNWDDLLERLLNEEVESP